jgi:hypothetical protein
MRIPNHPQCLRIKYRSASNLKSYSRLVIDVEYSLFLGQDLDFQRYYDLLFIEEAKKEG